MNSISRQTTASLVTGNRPVVQVLENYHLDVCCKVKRSLAESRNEKGLMVDRMSGEPESEMDPEFNREGPFDQMCVTQLINYILVRHHLYVKQSMPQIYMHLEMIVSKHGDHFPFMIEVGRLFAEIKEEMTDQMKKEEKVLFPLIREMERLNLKLGDADFPIVDLLEALAAMEAEHEQSGVTMQEIRRLTHQYSPPVGACTTFEICLEELKEFEHDLRVHVQIENNILFRKAKGWIVITNSCKL